MFIIKFICQYNSGTIQFKIDHGCYQNKMKWIMWVYVSDLRYDPILLHNYEGLIEENLSNYIFA